MHARKAKPVKNYDQIDITNLEDDFEDDFNLGLDERPTSFKSGFQIKQSHFSKPNTPRTIPTNNETQKSTVSKLDELNGSSQRSSNDVNIESADKDFKNSASSNNSHSPVSKPSNINTRTQLKPWDSLTGSPSTQNSKLTSASILATSGTSKTSLTRNDRSPLSTSRSGAMTTPLNQRAPVSSVQVTRRKRANPNEKGFGRDEQDMFIDDIEDF